ncbi:hypothetical protein M1843_00970 [Isoptericola sp. 4D.3]|uniref:Uncharacterized protein n=1 Tax=Isoptericola peretonis TaxID=2918523 RepID=A0ABT0IYK2_9MICO|nr:hypothetical protein [Isoptericola sp. 4D.3]
MRLINGAVDRGTVARAPVRDLPRTSSRRPSSPMSRAPEPPSRPMVGQVEGAPTRACRCGRSLVLQGGKVPEHKNKTTGEWCTAAAGRPSVTAATPQPRTGQPARPDKAVKRVSCPECGRSISRTSGSRVLPHLNTTGTRGRIVSGAPVDERARANARANRSPSTQNCRAVAGTARDASAAGAPGRPRRQPRGRLDPIERRERRIRDRAFADLEVRPPSEDLDDSLFRAQARRCGLPTLGGRR